MHMNGQTNLRTLENVSMSPNKNEISLVVERNHLPPHEVGVLSNHTHTHTHTHTHKTERKLKSNDGIRRQQISSQDGFCVCVCVCV